MDPAFLTTASTPAPGSSPAWPPAPSTPRPRCFARFTPEHPPEDTTRTALIAEVGRRLVEETHFVEADEEGEIVVPTGRYRVVAEPSRHLFVRVRFDFEDASTSVIREQGLFVGCETDPAYPSASATSARPR